MPNQNTENRAAQQNARAASGDAFDQDLERDNQRDSPASTMGELANRGEGAGLAAAPVDPTGSRTDRGEFPQHTRRGQAQSPVEETPNQPERSREGHPGGARDS